MRYDFAPFSDLDQIYPPLRMTFYPRVLKKLLRVNPYSPMVTQESFQLTKSPKPGNTYANYTR